MNPKVVVFSFCLLAVCVVTNAATTAAPEGTTGTAVTDSTATKETDAPTATNEPTTHVTEGTKTTVAKGTTSKADETTSGKPTTQPPTSTAQPPTPTTQPPIPPSTKKPTTGPTSQRFDAASFIGGIVLCGGLIAIVYFGCKFYKARNDRNYHQF